MRIEQISISKLSQNTGQIEGLPKNPRFIRDEKYAALVKSIQDDPEMLELRELIVYPLRGKFVVIAGNMRLRALTELGYKEAPCKVLDEVTPLSKLKAFAIKDNVPYGEHDWDALANEWDATELADWGLDIPDFALGGKQEVQEDDYEMPDEIETDIQPGDLFEIGPHRLICGDSTKADDVARLMDGAKADSVLTDPPYGQNQPGVANDDPKINQDIMNGAAKNLPIENAAVVAFNSTRTFPNWLTAMREFKFERMLWMYKKAQMAYPWRGWLLISEAILIHSIGVPNWNDSHPYSHDTYELPEVSGELPDGVGWHGSVKPQIVIQDILRRICGHGQSVYDPFLGSGTTMVAAHQLNRKCYGMEISEKYCQVIIDRMLKLDPALEIKKNGQPYFVAVSENYGQTTE